jgi:RNA recognition motif-containing protein
MKGNIDDKINCDIRVWESAGVLIPFVDMLNHVDDLPVARWREQSQDVVAEDADAGEQQPRRLTFHTDEKTKKHNQLYRNYGAHDNETFMLQYGFTRIGNPSDRVKIAWALVDGVGGVEPPMNYEPVSSEKCGDEKHIPSLSRVFDSSDPIVVKAWWSEQRLALLGGVMNNSDTLESLKKGKQMRFAAMNNGNIDSMLIAVAVVATITPKLVDEMYGKSVDSSMPLLDGLKLDKTAQNVVRLYLSYLFAKKLGKLLQSLNSCLRDHFDLNQLWTKASSGGVTYVGRLEENDGSVDVSGGESSSNAVGWNTFFDANVYTNSMEVEPGCGNYYAMAPKSCVLTLYDGHVKSLHRSLNVMATDATFYENTKRQLENLGCVLDRSTNITAGMTEVQPIVTPTSATVSEKEMEDQMKQLDELDERKASQDPISAVARNCEHENGQMNTSNRKRDRDKDKINKVDQRPPAIKLHIGNLSYKTQPNRLYDFFTALYGKGSVLECHIPTERETGASRGFGFVTMPDHHARTALESGRKHEMEGRILKVAESNSVGSSAKVMKQSRNAPPASSSDRCHDCGYSPRWCTCNPHISMHMNNNMGIGGPPLDIYGPGPYMGGGPPPMLGGPPGLYGHPPRDIMDDRYGHGFGGGSSGNRRSYSRSPSYRRDRDRGYRRSRSRSRSYSRGRGRGDRHHRDRRRYDDDDDRKRYDDDRRRGSSRRYRSKSRSSSRQRDKALSPNRSRLIGGDPAEFFDEPEGGGRSPSRSRSPPLDDSGMDRPSSSSKKKDGASVGSRSRSRERH